MSIHINLYPVYHNLITKLLLEIGISYLLAMTDNAAKNVHTETFLYDRFLKV